MKKGYSGQRLVLYSGKWFGWMMEESGQRMHVAGENVLGPNDGKPSHGGPEEPAEDQSSIDCSGCEETLKGFKQAVTWSESSFGRITWQLRQCTHSRGL